MTIKFHNTLSRQKEEFTSLTPGEVKIYTCGPTVYNYAHIGNYRTFIFEDLLRRYLQFRGYKVVQVQNLTDVDDKTIRASQEQGVPLNTYTQKYKDAFFADLRTLNIEPAEYYPAATDTIPEMIDLTNVLLAKGLAYQSEDKSIYFSIDKFPGYGKLAHLDRAGMKHGARVAHDEYEKENLADFALWKAWDEKDGAVFWESPWGRGRPGWHLECSAMSMKLLGETFDIHTGGVDNIFPHHEDEIAQSEGATGKLPANYWMHCAHLVVEGKKMAKSAGNFFTLRDLLDRDYSGRALRYVLLGAHYRQSLNFSFDSLHAAQAALERLDDFSQKLRQAEPAVGEGALPSWAQEAQEKFIASLDDDLNIAGALAAVFDLVYAGNKAMGDSKIDLKGVRALWQSWDKVLGFLNWPEEKPGEAVQTLVQARQSAREAKNWAEADRCRSEILALGWLVKDTPQGPELIRKR